jgi:hypothetical protein
MVVLVRLYGHFYSSVRVRISGGEIVALGDAEGFKILQHIILLQPLTDAFVLCLLFGFYSRSDLLEFMSINDNIIKGIIIDQ